jgi:hypothetical protein
LRIGGVRKSIFIDSPRLTSWHAPDGKKIRDFLTRVGVDVMGAAVYVPVGSNG